MRRAPRAIVVGATSLVSAVAVWLPLEVSLGLERPTAQFFGALIAAVVLSVGLVWAFRDPVTDPMRVRVPLWAMQRPDKTDIARPELADLVVAQLEGAEGGTIGLTTALVGAGGFGKTTLARQICWDRRVRRRFRTGVWITLGQQPTGGELADKVNDVYDKLTGHRPAFTDPNLAGQHLGELLRESGMCLRRQPARYCDMPGSATRGRM